MINIEKFLTAFYENDVNSVDKFIDELIDLCPLDDTVQGSFRTTNQIFDLIIDVSTDSRYISSNISHNFIMDIQAQLLEGFSPLQISLYTNCLIKSYGRFADYLSCYLIGEILADYFSGNDALERLLRLNNDENENKSTLPYCVLCLRRKSTSTEFNSRLIEFLKQLGIDTNKMT